MRAAVPPHGKVTRVAVGVLIRADGWVLLADRPAGKPYAGYWEFPGGKIEPGEEVAVALERELHEELGIDIGPSVPWVTFEFDYPHAYVELQFRVVRAWRGDPHAREGQQLRFVDPAGRLPQPVLPAAVPALRWLLLPRTVMVVGPQGPSGSPAGGGDSLGVEAGRAAPIVVVDADWRAVGPRDLLSRLRAEPGTRKCQLLTSGPGAPPIGDADGAVLDAGSIADAGRWAGGLRGAWVGSRGELQLAAKAGCDFVLVRSSGLAEELRIHPASLPAYFPCDRASIMAPEPAPSPGQGRWIDLRPPGEPGD
jgi:8-oxo-dGTP diphosphatase